MRTQLCTVHACARGLVLLALLICLQSLHCTGLGDETHPLKFLGVRRDTLSVSSKRSGVRASCCLCRPESLWSEHERKHSGENM
jgi:hypothetical protein